MALEQKASDQPFAAAARQVRRSPLWWGVLLFVVALVALFAYAVLRPTGAADPAVALNSPAPSFTLPLYSGGNLSLKQLRGKTVVVNFWWSGCAPCIQEAGILESQWQTWKNKNVVFVGIDELDDHTSSAPRDFLRRYGVTYPNGWDPGDLNIQFSTTGQPETFFITPDGKMKSKYVQPFPDGATLSQFIAQARI